MKLLRLKVIEADTCGGLLNGSEIYFREGEIDFSLFSPLCLVGPNGSGKSQILQIIAEIFQAMFSAYLPDEEQGTPNDNIYFELEYLYFQLDGTATRVLGYREKHKKNKKGPIVFKKLVGEFFELMDDVNEIKKVLPDKVVGYTSGGNETLSIPFFVSRAGYANQVRTNAKNEELRELPIKDSRMLLVDYGTNLEVLVANLLLNPLEVRENLVRAPNLKELKSFRCVVQLDHTDAPSGGVKLTKELEDSIEYLKKSATCYYLDSDTKSYIFDFFVQDGVHKAFGYFWKGGALELYSCFHKLAMLNDLVIPKKERDMFERGVKNRRFASRLPEPMERQKVFRFERVEFVSKKSDQIVDYVSLSDGEHQLAQLLGTLCMVNFPNVLFLLDEPESHFNPRWRVEFISKIMELPTASGNRMDSSPVSKQDCLITTHSPFVPSDMKSDNVLVFKKDPETNKISISKPNFQTYGSTFDTILEGCFEIYPPMSKMPNNEIDRLMNSDDIDEISNAIQGLGDSVERIYLADRVRVLKAKEQQ